MRLCKIYTALVTPFDPNGEIDFAGLERLIEALYEKGMRGFLIAGTTGEASTLSDTEKENMVRFIRRLHDDISLMLGIGGNDTAQVVESIMRFNQVAGIDAYLSVVPYYNKPSQAGIQAHFMMIDLISERPVLIYHVPHRCGVTLDVETLARLYHDSKHIVGIKHASKDMNMIKEIKKRYPNHLVYAGDDAVMLDALEAGADGVISVISQIVPEVVTDLINRYDHDEDCFALAEYLGLVAKYSMIEPNPAPVKYILFKRGLIENVLRLPMTVISPNHEALLNLLFDLEES